jgi:hypothetical protein
MDDAELAYLYPEPLWRSGEWVKNVLLLFDGVTLLVPDYMREAPARVDVEIGQPLEEMGLLRVLSPEQLVDADVTSRLVTVLVDLIAAGAFDELPSAGVFHNLSYSRLGYRGDPSLSRMVIEELEARGLAQRSVDGVSIPVHPLVRWSVLILLSQLMTSQPLEDGSRLEPVTDRPQVHRALAEVLSLPRMPTAGTVYATDISSLGLDLTGIPLDEVLQFREQHGPAYRAYARNVRDFARTLGTYSERDQASAQADRREALADELAGLQRLPDKAWRSTSGMVLGVVGATYKALKGDFVEAVQDFSSGALGIESKGQSQTAFGYLLTARSTLPH